MKTSSRNQRRWWNSNSQRVNNSNLSNHRLLSSLLSQARTSSRLLRSLSSSLDRKLRALRECLWTRNLLRDNLSRSFSHQLNSLQDSPSNHHSTSTTKSIQLLLHQRLVSTTLPSSIHLSNRSCTQRQSRKLLQNHKSTSKISIMSRLILSQSTSQYLSAMDSHITEAKDSRPCTIHK